MKQEKQEKMNLKNLDLKYSEEKHRVLQFLYTDLNLLSRRSTPIDSFFC